MTKSSEGDVYLQGAEQLGRAMLDARDVQPGNGTSFIAADRDHEAGGLDAVAGSEFVDDQIRLE